jgi:chromosomal replication initiator protein
MNQTLALKQWKNTLENLKKALSKQGFETWIAPLKFISYVDSEKTLSIQAPNKFSHDWIKERYLPVIEKAVYPSFNDTEIKVDISIAQLSSVDYEKITEFSKDEIKKTISNNNRNNTLAAILNPKYTFDTFVVGPSNQITHAAAIAVAESPARAYNPLFIHGKVGLGKTHIMHAIAHFIKQKNENYKICYISCETFINKYIDSLQQRTSREFRNKYRSVDILVIDDIHFLANKEACQEEFFHTFNALYDAHKQIIISSDKPPKEIPTLEKRLVSRFEWGLITDIQPPDLETRIAILREKSKIENITIPEEVTSFIAQKIKFNIRELEGALTKITAYKNLTKKEVDIETAVNILQDYISKKNINVSIDLIIRKVADYFNISISDIKSENRTKNIAFARHISMYLCRELTTLSLPEIGQFLGGRDHTTVLYGYNKIKKVQSKDPNIKNLVNLLISEIEQY